MHHEFEYTNPLEIVSLFHSKKDLIDFFTFLIEKTQIAANLHDICPIIYVKKAYAINIDYNYLIHTIADWSKIEQIREDFILHEFKNNQGLHPFGMFLIKGLFEHFYGLVWLGDTIDTSKYSGGIVKPKPRFYNYMVVKNKNTHVLLLAVPFSKSALRELLPWEKYMALLALGKNKYHQLAFGQTQYSQLDATIHEKLKRF